HNKNYHNNGHNDNYSTTQCFIPTLISTSELISVSEPIFTPLTTSISEPISTPEPTSTHESAFTSEPTSNSEVNPTLGCCQKRCGPGWRNKIHEMNAAYQHYYMNNTIFNISAQKCCFLCIEDKNCLQWALEHISERLGNLYAPKETENRKKAETLLQKEL
ncbi:20034_t:CDS:2, partial [Gigaspora margarita]